MSDGGCREPVIVYGPVIVFLLTLWLGFCCFYPMFSGPSSRRDDWSDRGRP